jgi:hypothetical protein
MAKKANTTPTDETEARLRGIYPDTVALSYSEEERVLVTVAIDVAAYRWLQGAVGDTLFTMDIEETFNTMARSLQGELPLAMLVQWASRKQGRSGAAAMFGDCLDEKEAVRLLNKAVTAATGRQPPS